MCICRLIRRMDMDVYNISTHVWSYKQEGKGRKVIGFLMAQVMKKTQGKANPVVVDQIMKEMVVKMEKKE